MARPPKKVHASAVSGDSAKTSDTAQEGVVVTAAPVVADAPVAADAPALFATGVDAPEPAAVVKPKSAKASRRAKTCERCEERRKREREYARVSRDRARVARLDKKGETTAEQEKVAEKPEDGSMKASE
jgi:hypothetical protein